MQHAGQVYTGGVAGHAAFGWAGGRDDSIRSMATDHEVSGVTAACALISRDLYFEVGGFTLALPGNYNDVDLNMKVRVDGPVRGVQPVGAAVPLRVEDPRPAHPRSPTCPRCRGAGRVACRRSSTRACSEARVRRAMGATRRRRVGCPCGAGATARRGEHAGRRGVRQRLAPVAHRARARRRPRVVAEHGVRGARCRAHERRRCRSACTRSGSSPASSKTARAKLEPARLARRWCRGRCRRARPASSSATICAREVARSRSAGRPGRRRRDQVSRSRGEREHGLRRSSARAAPYSQAVRTM